MALYLWPPRGKVSLATIERAVKARLTFLLKVARCCGNTVALQDVVMETESVESADCLTEGSTKDRISHFTLRLACAGDPKMADFLFCSESQFFSYRVSCMTEQELINHVVAPLKQLQNHLNILPEAPPEAIQDVAEILLDMTKMWDLETLVRQYSLGSRDCVMAVPFEHMLELVASRSVMLQNGRVLLSCSRLCHLLSVINGKLLSYGLTVAKAKHQIVKQDSRFRKMFREIKMLFYREYPCLQPQSPSIFGNMHVDEVDTQVHSFPPCMMNVHRILRKRHRLKHADRIQYTLFLKELGMPVHEALQFWRLEYSQPTSCRGDDCGHDWSRDARRYTYNIRHLYGLEGSRINYRGHSCNALQGRSPGPLESGGCPFTTCDAQRLSQLMTEEGIGELDQHSIITRVSNGQYMEACYAFQERKFALLLKREGYTSKYQKPTNIAFGDVKPPLMVNKCVDHSECCSVPTCREKLKSKDLHVLLRNHPGTRIAFCDPRELSCLAESSGETTSVCLQGPSELTIRQRPNMVDIQHVACDRCIIPERTPNSSKVEFLKPVDYVSSFTKLIKGLKETSNGS